MEMIFSRFSKITILIVVSLLMHALITASCSHKPCNNIPQRSPSPEASPSPDEDEDEDEVVKPSPIPSPKKSDFSLPKGPKVWVSKPTGELQCGGGNVVSLEDTQKTLSLANIPVGESHTQKDGLMHMAVCGSPTGNIHVFQIPKSSLGKAKKLGFKEFKK